ncbi:uncharacterized protein LOC111631913 [Centruroides sculpturatus]|uniref:uncharacterized protein LOC111631913 n=1 Tax=Centruroides sculpturatus TaxID=218467 RepID=UPI000C6E1BAF|nr:uncharacterized protein LOC111631913 [Centruroides sculpturatus]
MYDNFISIEKISSANLPLNFKFKINDFMKRFGKIPLGISIGGFFYIKQDFPIRVSFHLFSNNVDRHHIEIILIKYRYFQVLSAIYSIFSSCIQVSGILKKETKCIIKQGNNTHGI